MIKRTLICAGLLLALALPASAQQTVFIVRHAERADTGSGLKPANDADPDLSAAGRARAESLATVLKDAAIASIYTTELKRTQQTAAPLAKSLGLSITTVKATDTPALVAQLKSAKGNILVVGHSNTVPAIVKALGVTSPVTVADDEFDKLFVVTASTSTATTGSPSLVLLRYR
jgi:broad specificity phosphatase PhoE